jgi:hypothetical protein
MMKTKKTITICAVLFLFPLLPGTIILASDKDVEIQGTNVTSRKPPFSLTLPAVFRSIDFFSQENPGESSFTRAYFLVKAKDQRMEELFILQISDRTDPQSGPMTVSPLKPYTEKRLYAREKIKKGDLTGESLVQLMAWNPEAPSLQGVVRKGIVIPPQWALQGQFQFLYRGEHAVSFRYSKDIGSFGMRVSEDGKRWEKDSLTGNEKKAYEIFRKVFSGMIDSVRVKNPINQ